MLEWLPSITATYSTATFAPRRVEAAARLHRPNYDASWHISDVGPYRGPGEPVLGEGEDCCRCRRATGADEAPHCIEVHLRQRRRRPVRTGRTLARSARECPSSRGRRLGGAADRSNVSTSDFTVEHVLANDVCRPIAYLEPRPAGASASKWSPDNVPPVGR